MEEASVEIQARIKLKHGGLLRWMQENNVTQRELGKALGISSTTINHWVNLRSKPHKKYHEKLELLTGVSISMLFPGWFKPKELKQLVEDKGTVTKNLNEDAVRMLQAANETSRALLIETQFEMQDQLAYIYEAISTSLEPREQKIINMRMDGDTYKEIGAHFDFSATRAMEIEKKGMKKLKRALYAKGVDGVEL
jgi:RNA polymerase sigma factor (sigma-70 family)